MLAMDPKTNKRLACNGLALRDLVLVVGKDVVHTATVDIQRGTQFFHRHCRAFQVPSGTALSERSIPEGFLIVFLRFPQDKVSRFLLLIFVGVDPRTYLQ